MMKTSATGVTGFRRDINGLRAVAVLAVILFHFQVPGFQGGFVGVDVFFVISGYLMTKIILGQLSASRFSVLDFFRGRLTRIYPPMLTLIAILVALGYLFLNPTDYMVLAKRSIAAAASASNILFYRESSDYFSASQKSNWLLHLWSLGVEVQFYFVYPFLLWTAYRRRCVLPLLVILLLASFALSVWLTPKSQAVAFYLLPTRTWEFIAGGLALIGGQRLPQRLRAPVYWVGLTLIAVSLLKYRESMSFPGWIAFAPVAGTALVIIASTETRFLSNPVFQRLGTISYSLYLWHWPVWVAAQQYQLAVGPLTQSALFLVSISLAAVSYRLIEVPINSMRHKAWHPGVAICGVLVSSAILASIGWQITTHSGLPGRVPEVISGVVNRFSVDIAKRTRSGVCFLTLGQGPSDFKDSCFATPAGPKKTVFIWGDSYAAHLWFGLAASKETASTVLLGATSAGCLPLLDAPSAFNADCSRNNKRAIDEISRLKPDTVLLFGRWTYAEERGINVVAGIKKTAEFLLESGREVIIVGPNPEWQPNLPQRLLQESFAHGGVIPAALSDASQQVTKSLDARLRQQLEGSPARYVSPYSTFCDPKGCQTMVSIDGRTELVAYDFGHLTVLGAEYIVRAALREAGEQLVKTNSPFTQR